MILNGVVLKQGDIILSRDRGWLSKAIRFFGWIKTGECEVSHAAIYAGEVLGEESVIEALWRVAMNTAKKYLKQEVIILRNNLLTEEDNSKILQHVIPIMNEGYGYGKIALLALDSVFRTYWFTQHWGITNFKVCSQLIAWAYYKTFEDFKPEGVRDNPHDNYCKALGLDLAFGIGWRSVAPDTMLDYAKTHTKIWSIYRAAK